MQKTWPLPQAPATPADSRPARKSFSNALGNGHKWMHSIRLQIGLTLGALF